MKLLYIKISTQLNNKIKNYIYFDSSHFSMIPPDVLLDLKSSYFSINILAVSYKKKSSFNYDTHTHTHKILYYRKYGQITHSLNTYLQTPQFLPSNTHNFLTFHSFMPVFYYYLQVLIINLLPRYRRESLSLPCT